MRRRDRRSRNVTYATTLLILATAACSSPHVDVAALTSKNPTAFVFPKSVEAVNLAIGEAFSDFRYRQMNLTLLPDHRGARLTTHHEPISLSPVYRLRGKNLPYMAEFLLQLDPLPDGSGTRVTVIASRTEVIAGQTLGFLNPHGPANIYVAVEATSIEEYEILQILGAHLGTTLPPSVTPPAPPFDPLAYMRELRR